MSAPVFSNLVGQSHAITYIERALADSPEKGGQGMTHAWLFTGPPGSGRSNIAKAFAAALICKDGGCGDCSDCITAQAGTHADVELVDTEGNSIRIDEIREVISRAAWGASLARWRVVVIEDCDRMTEASANALLKSLEEPGISTVWLLCAPTLQDVLPTIRSRCRHINLRTPTSSEITNHLIKNQRVKVEAAELAATISQGHIGKATRFLQDEESKPIRRRNFELLFSVKSEADAIRASSELLTLAQKIAEQRLAEKTEIESEKLKTAMQSVGRGMSTGGSKALRELERDQKARTSRAIKDQVDIFLLDYLTFFRDCLANGGPIINPDLKNDIARLSSSHYESALISLISKLNLVRELSSTSTSQVLLLETFFIHFAMLNLGN